MEMANVNGINLLLGEIMTDKEKLEKLLTEFKVGFTEEAGAIVCEEGNENIGGYNGFMTTFEFDQEGTFIQMGAWE